MLPIAVVALDEDRPAVPRGLGAGPVVEGEERGPIEGDLVRW